jgi:UDP-GlcNAc:undecaprenyl-phosphate GlcNAc-1-phosphate transferase
MAPYFFELAFLSIAVFLCALLGTALMRHLAHRNGWVARPRQDRWHRQATALHGGAGFYPAFLIGTCWVLVRGFEIDWAGRNLFESPPEEMRLAIALLGGSLLMFLFGLWDDLKNSRPATKLTCELLAASLFIFAGGMFPLTGSIVLDTLVTYFWFVGVINATNMLDNMDGLSSGVVIISASTLTILAMYGHGFAGNSPLVVPLSMVFVAALLGFWIHNRPPAKIFMGDSGSLFIGYALAAMAVPSSLNDFFGTQAIEGALGPVLVLLIPATVVAIPIFDTTLVTITRKWRAQKASQGGRDHSSHRLVGLGLTEKTTVWVLYTFAAFGGMVAIFMQRFPEQALPLFGIFAIVLVLTGVYLGHVKVETAEQHRLPPAWTPLVTEIFYKRHAAEVLMDTVLIVICFHVAYLLRFDGTLSEATDHAMVFSLPLVVASCLVMFFVAGIYRGQWHLISVSDLPFYAFGVFGGVSLSLAAVTIFTRFEAGHSRSAFMIFGLLLFLAISGSRVSFRLLDSLVHHNGSQRNGQDQRPILIFGAGRTGKIIHEEITFNPVFKNFQVIGFLDDDPNLKRRAINRVPILGSSSDLLSILDRQSVASLVISSEKIRPDRLEEVLAICNAHRIPVMQASLKLEPIGTNESGGNGGGENGGDPNAVVPASQPGFVPPLISWTL